jgi:phage-related baseplate assembly protein
MTYSQGRIVLSPSVVVGEGDQLTLSEYTYQTSLVAEAQRLIEGDRLNANVPTYRAAGVVVEVVPAEKLLVAVSATIVTNDGYDRDAVLAEVRTEISNYINTLPIGGDVVVSEIIERAMSVRGMYDISISQPTTNIPVAFNEVARALFDEIGVQ